jgi:hypothetical protein
LAIARQGTWRVCRLPSRGRPVEGAHPERGPLPGGRRTPRLAMARTVDFRWPAADHRPHWSFPFGESRVGATDLGHQSPAVVGRPDGCTPRSEASKFKMF